MSKFNELQEGHPVLNPIEALRVVAILENADEKLALLDMLSSDISLLESTSNQDDEEEDSSNQTNTVVSFHLEDLINYYL
jgi:hypothetical protein